MYKCRWFRIYELVPSEVYYRAGKTNRVESLWYLFDNRILITADWLRTTYGKMLANTWYWEGRHQYRGWRPWSCPIGAEWSQHKFGRALDLIPLETTAEKIRQDIIKSPWDFIFQHITCIENEISWLHMDCRNWDKSENGLLIVKP